MSEVKPVFPRSPDVIPNYDKFVDILQLRFPLITQEEAITMLLQQIASGSGGGVCFPDMSTLNLAEKDPSYKALLRQRVLTLNDGAGLAWMARRRGHPFPDNLNGTDLCPLLFARAPNKTRVFLLGGKSGTADRARDKLACTYPHLEFVGAYHGHFSEGEEQKVIALLRELKPQILLVGMGNPLQIRFIDRYLDDSAFRQTLFLAVGGFMHYYSGELSRAPVWVRLLRLEWLYITLQQPHKLKRYFIGIPFFLFNCLRAEFLGRHDIPIVEQITTKGE